MKYCVIKSGFVFLLLIFSTCNFAQVAAVRFTVQVPTVDEKSKGVFLAGSFNYWHAGDSLYRLKEIEKGIYAIILPVFTDHPYTYKYTLGNWEHVEIALNDSDIQNRQFISSDQLQITDTVAKWKQPKPLGNTISPQMQKINAMKDTALGKLEPEIEHMKQLFLPYIENLLRDKPSRRLNKQLNKKAVKKIGYAYGQVAQLFWDVFATLSKDQKEKIRDSISQPAAKADIINAVLNAVKAVTQEGPSS